MAQPVSHISRVKVGAYYTDGVRLAGVVRVYPAGHVGMRDAATGEHIGEGIVLFRKYWWLVKAAPEVPELEAA